MTIQAHISLPDDLFNELERRAPQLESRSVLIADALRDFFAAHNEVADELAQINRYADELNQEAEDVLAYQVMCEER